VKTALTPTSSALLPFWQQFFFAASGKCMMAGPISRADNSVHRVR
jgi:hypothetical protein